MNAMVGLCRARATSARDVCHLNLHKTFCIPHGGGGPGMGPIGVAKHLAPFLPGHAVVRSGGAQAHRRRERGAVGEREHPADLDDVHRHDGRRRAHAARRRSRSSTRTTWRSGSTPHYPVLYRGRTARVAHECIIDPRALQDERRRRGRGHREAADGLRLPRADVSFPVAGTLMIEPTESEPKAELDRFCDALIAIRGEIREIERGRADRERQSAEARAAHAGAVVTTRGTGRTRASRRHSRAVDARAEILAGGGAGRERVRGPEPGVFVPADRRVPAGIVERQSSGRTRLELLNAND